MNDEDYAKFKKLQSKADCCAGSDLPPALAKIAKEEGMRLAQEGEDKNAEYRLCVKESAARMILEDSVVGDCSRCKCRVIYTPPLPAAQQLVCIDCALSLEDKEISE